MLSLEGFFVSFLLLLVSAVITSGLDSGFRWPFAKEKSFFFSAKTWILVHGECTRALKWRYKCHGSVS